MHRLAPVALATLLAATALAHSQVPTPTPEIKQPPAAPAHFTDPANLAGERVRPRNGRELPIDGGDGNNALGLAQMLRKLNTRASLMLIVAHPDDEDGGMLTYYSRGLGARVAILTLNRGEGGQNAMTGDFEDALGLLRTQELLSADRYMGVDQFFGTEVDFGFTKTKEEAFKKWGHDRVLYDAVRAVRIYRPLVIAAVFSGAVTDGHGQHQVSGQIAQEVFKAAGDPTIFPELTREGILPWQPLKVYARVPFSRVTQQGLFDSATGQTVPAQFTNYVTGQTFTTAPTADVTINEGQPDPLLTYAAASSADLRIKPSNPNEQLSYVQFARIGLGLQRSQIGGGMRVPAPGRVDVSYHLYGSRVCAPGLPNPTPPLCHPERSADRANSKAVILSDRSGAKGVEEPQGSSTSNNSSSLFNPEASKAPSFFDGIDTSLEGIATMAPKGIPALAADLRHIAQEIDEAQRLYDPHNLSACAVPLAQADAALLQLIDQVGRGDPMTQVANNANLTAWSPGQRENIVHELKIKQVQTNDALALALNVQVDATIPSSNGDIIASSAPSVQVAISADPKLALSIVGPKIRNDQAQTINANIPLVEPGQRKRAIVDWFSRPLPTSGTSITLVAVHGEGLKQVTRPYFTRSDAERSFYDLSDPQLRNAPTSPPALTANVQVVYQELSIGVARVVHSGPQPVEIIPPVSIAFDSNANVVPLSTKAFKTDIHVENVRNTPINGSLSLAAPVGWSLTHREIALTDVPSLKTVSSPIEIDAQSIHATSTPARSGIYASLSIAGDPGQRYTEGFRAIGYGTLPRTNYYTPATLRVVPVDLKLPPENKRRIAYLPGTGDDIPSALASIGLTPTILKVSDLTPANLSHFDTVILGVRTYNAHPDLHGAPTQALLDFARNGGNVVVQTQTPEFTAADAPYPLTDRNERVIDETSAVKLLNTDSPLLNTPNKITPADFNNWIEERGHGFLDSWDSHYTALTETGDPGAPAEHIEPQEPQRGGLITVQLGKGRWTYCAFALYRQLPEAVPGAFRLFVNLLNP